MNTGMTSRGRDQQQKPQGQWDESRQGETKEEREERLARERWVALQSPDVLHVHSWLLALAANCIPLRMEELWPRLMAMHPFVQKRPLDAFNNEVMEEAMCVAQGHMPTTGQLLPLLDAWTARAWKRTTALRQAALPAPQAVPLGRPSPEAIAAVRRIVASLRLPDALGEPETEAAARRRRLAAADLRQRIVIARAAVERGEPGAADKLQRLLERQNKPEGGDHE